ncbi:histidine kinase [Streptomyces sp. YC419]|uniref:histidine kinase n=2 Tax=Streptomyces ureilyticus TaxID=1775131 RepID=A0ABX0DLH9_9ACTN|nr:histidine kinase [Streptomyces ureilyticus]
MPYVLVGDVVMSLAFGPRNGTGPLDSQLSAFAVGLPLAAITSLFPLTRPMSVAAARALCGVDGDRLADGPARTRAAKGRTAAWFTLHLAFGGVIAGMSLAVPPFAAVLIMLPVFAGLRDSGLPELFDHTWVLVLSPVAGVACLLALAGCAAGAGTLLARWAPELLGPTPEDRLAAAEARAADLAVRNRLARELHDSVGHALSAVTLQASAARRVLDSDPEFVREALAAIEDTTRRTVGELDAVLGVLRECEGAGTSPAPTLAELDGLLRRTRAGGLRVTATVAVDATALPPLVSREAYRIVQEGLSNALKHAGDQVTVTLRIEVTGKELEITLENAVPRTAAPRPGGGHGLRGIADRARLLGGTTGTGAVDGVWRLHVRLPVERATTSEGPA